MSKNLVHRNDHLQVGYAELLQNALSVNPGVATIEVDEVQAIRRELDIGAVDKLHRVVPILVGAEYEMKHQAAHTPPIVNLVVRLKGKNATERTIPKGQKKYAKPKPW